MNILITGGAGFIASHIVDKYIAEGNHVVVVDNLSAGSLNNLNKKAEFYNIDIYKNPLGEIIQKHKIDVICHHAAQIDLRKSISDPVYDARINIEGSLNLFQAALKSGVRKIIFASSGGSIYGEQKEFPARENHSKNPISPYGISKLAVEKYLKFYKFHYGIEHIILRYSNVYGPRQSSKGDCGVISVFCKLLNEKKQPVLNGDGTNTRDYLYVQDVVEANLNALHYNGSAIVNISTAAETNLNELFKLINESYGNIAKEVHGNPIPGEQKRSVLDNSKAKEILNWAPEFNIEKGIAETCKWFIENSINKSE